MISSEPSGKTGGSLFVAGARMHLIHRCLPNLGLPLWVGLSAHTARALATWPVSAPIPKAKTPFLEIEKCKKRQCINRTEKPRKSTEKHRKSPDFRRFSILANYLYETVRKCAKLYEIVRNCTKLYGSQKNCTNCTKLYELYNSYKKWRRCIGLKQTGVVMLYPHQCRSVSATGRR